MGEHTAMVGWIKKLFGKTSAPASPQVPPAQMPKAATRAPAATAPRADAPAPAPSVQARTEPAAATSADDASGRADPTAPPPAAASRRSLAAGARKRHVPAVGMTAQLILPGKVSAVTIVSVQAAGRRLLAKANGAGRPQAFTLRADQSYRLAGAPDRSAIRLVLEPA